MKPPLDAQKYFPPPFPTTFRWRLLETLFRLLAFVRLPELLMFFNRIFKPNLRPLTERERYLAASVFGESIDLQKVRLDERSHIGCRRHHFAYVGFHFINSWGQLEDSILIHELVHIWQYERFGIVYIPRALFAQTTVEGYNYGGIERLRQVRRLGLRLSDFNYEQQGDIIADGFRLRMGLQPRWCRFDLTYLPDFEYFMAQVQMKNGDSD